MNPNYNVDPKTGKKIPLNDTMAKHAVHVWQNYVINSGFKNILVLAHSAGGMCLEAIMRTFPDTFYQQVSKIALTDSKVISAKHLSDEQHAFVQTNAIHYIASQD